MILAHPKLSATPADFHTFKTFSLPTLISKTSDGFLTSFYILLLFTLFILFIYSCDSWQQSRDTWMFQASVKSKSKGSFEDISNFSGMSKGFKTSAKMFNIHPERPSACFGCFHKQKETHKNALGSLCSVKLLVFHLSSFIIWTKQEFKLYGYHKPVLCYWSLIYTSETSYPCLGGFTAKQRWSVSLNTPSFIHQHSSSVPALSCSGWMQPDHCRVS